MTAFRRFASRFGPELWLIVATTAAGIWAAGRWVQPMSDPGLWWSVTGRILSGERYYRDIPLQFGPLSPYLLASLASIFGLSVRFFLLVNWIAALVASTLLLFFVRPLFTTAERYLVATLLIGTSVLAPGPGRLVYPYSPAAVHALCLGVGALLASRFGRASSYPLVSGALAGLAFAAKQEIGIAAAAAVVVGTLVASRPRSDIARTSAAFLVVAGASVAFALVSAPLASLVSEGHYWPLAPVPPEWRHLYAGVAGMDAPGWWVPVLESAASLVVYVAALALVSTLARDRAPSHWIPPAAAMLLAFGALALSGRALELPFRPASLNVLACALVLTHALLARPAGAASIAALTTFSGLIGARALFSRHLGGPYAGVAHFGSGAIWALLILGVAADLVVRGAGSRPVFRRLAGVALGAAALLLGGEGVLALKPDARPVVSRIGRFFLSEKSAEFFGRLGGEISHGERVLLLPETNGVDIAFELADATRFPILMPGTLTPAVERRVIDDCRRRPPSAIVEFRRSTEEYGTAAFGQGYGLELDRWIRTSYTPVVVSSEGTILRPRESHSIPERDTDRSGPE